MKIILETNKCIGCGACQVVCEKFFELKDDGKSHLKGGEAVGENEELETSEPSCAKEAVENCPVQCIQIK